MDRVTTSALQEFESVDIEDFFDAEKIAEDAVLGTIVILTPQERALVDFLTQQIRDDPKQLQKVRLRLSDLERLGAAIAHFPSLLERHSLVVGERTPEALIDSLITYHEDGDTTLHLPSKATLGRGFLVAKIHTFDSLLRIAKNMGLEKKTIQQLQNATTSMMFLLLAEDVYLDLIGDNTLEIDFRRQIALSLVLLWEHRVDQNIEDISPMLKAVWTARRTLAPAFGTMVGTSELLLMSIEMDESWAQFIKQKMGDSDVSQAMEEFLFGLSHEQVTHLRKILRDKGVRAIGRDEVSSFLGERVKTDISLDYRDFYLLYTVRRDNARARRRLNLPGPKKTLEDHFIGFIMRLNKERQVRDAAAGI